MAIISLLVTIATMVGVLALIFLIIGFFFEEEVECEESQYTEWFVKIT